MEFANAEDSALTIYDLETAGRLQTFDLKGVPACSPVFDPASERLTLMGTHEKPTLIYSRHAKPLTPAAE